MPPVDAKIEIEEEYSDTVPVQYARGYEKFMGMEIAVDERVLIPRPETELLAKVAGDFCRGRSLERPYFLEIGTGSGALALGLIKLIPRGRVLAADVSSSALDVARLNLGRFDMLDRVTLVMSDMFGAFEEGYDSAFDAVISNPPYVSAKDYERADEWVKAEPRIALLAGEDGMDFIKILAGESARFIRPGGFLAIEVGYDQGKKTRELLSAHGFVDIECFFDEGGHERVITGWKENG